MVIKSSFYIPEVHSVFSVIKELTNIEGWRAWDPEIREAKLLQKYSSNLASYSYVKEHVPGNLYQFAEKQIIFTEEDEVYVYRSDVPGNIEKKPGIEKGKTIIDAKKIYVEEEYIVIQWIRQTNEKKLDDDAYHTKYLGFKDALLNRLSAKTTNS